VAERDLPGPADKDVEAERGNEEIGERLQHEDEEGVVEHDRQQREDGCGNRDGRPILRSGERERRQSHVTPW
jgi:hypothetical protein